MAFITLLIIALLAFTAYLTIFMRDSDPQRQDSFASSPLGDTESPRESVSGQNASVIEGTDSLASHRFIFVGDSRTVGMQAAVKESHPEDTCMFVAQSGEGYVWFRDTGMAQLEQCIAEDSSCPVILNLGVNDFKNIEDYIVLYQDLFDRYPDTDFYLLSVNPVMDELCTAVSNKDISAFNNRLKEVFPDRFLDCYTYLLSTSLETMDGLHYTSNTYNAIHEYVIEKLS